MWKFLKWVFGFSKQYHTQQKQYRKSGIVGKITTLVIMLGFCGLGIWLEFVCFDFFKTHLGYAILLSIFTVALIASSIKTSGVYSVVAFLNIIHSTAESFVEKKAKEELVKNYEVKDGEIVVREEKLTKEQLAQQDIKVKKQHRWLDIVCGILYGIACVGLLVASITLVFLALQGKF